VAGEEMLEESSEDEVEREIMSKRLRYSEIPSENR
jgi:hypothetical protein